MSTKKSPTLATNSELRACSFIANYYLIVNLARFIFDEISLVKIEQADC